MSEQPSIQEKIQTLETEMADPSFWQNKARAEEVLKEFNALKAELAEQGKYDKGPAIMTIFSGAGGDDSEDFSQMLFMMYQRFADKKGYTLSIIHKNENSHGGFRNITAEIVGKGAYKMLKNESGVHRLVRISPFNAKKLRHTSFSMVEVIPKLEKGGNIIIPEEDLRVEFSRSGGAGGQNVNKRETAVRVVHIPTGLAVHCEVERSQAQNRDRAVEILKGKLFKLQEEAERQKKSGMQISKTTEVEWGNQIRSYVLHPYKMVKDHRTDFETSNVDAVLGGELDGFIEAEKDL